MLSASNLVNTQIGAIAWFDLDIGDGDTFLEWKLASTTFFSFVATRSVVINASPG